MIVNVWEQAPQAATELLPLASAHGWRNLPVCAHDVRVAWKRDAADVSGSVLLRRHLPSSRQFSAVAPTFEAPMNALAWEAHEWVAVEAWRAQRKAHAVNGLRPAASRGI